MPHLSQPKLVRSSIKYARHATPIHNRTLEFHKKIDNTGVDAADWAKYMVLY